MYIYMTFMHAHIYVKHKRLPQKVGWNWWTHLSSIELAKLKKAAYKICQYGRYLSLGSIWIDGETFGEGIWWVLPNSSWQMKGTVRISLKRTIKSLVIIGHIIDQHQPDADQIWPLLQCLKSGPPPPLNTLRLVQNSWYLAHKIFKFDFSYQIWCIWFRFHWNLPYVSDYK